MTVTAIRPRLLGASREMTVSRAVDTIHRLLLLDPNDAVVLGAETELAILAVLAISDQTVLILEDLATLRTQLQVLSGPEWGACSRKIRNLEEAVAVQRERLRQIGTASGVRESHFAAIELEPIS